MHDFLYNFVYNIYLSKKNLAKYYHKRLYVQYPLFLSDFKETSIFSTVFRKKKNAEISNFIKTRPKEVELFIAHGQKKEQTDERTNIYNNKIRFWQFCKRA